MNTLNVKTGDTVVVLSGKDKGKQGKVLSVSLLPLLSLRSALTVVFELLWLT